MYRDDLRRHPTRALLPTELPPGGIDDKVVVLVDDVCTTGAPSAPRSTPSTTSAGRARRLAVLVDRGHRELPIRADHVGKKLPTSSAERVSVLLTELDARDAVLITGGGN